MTEREKEVFRDVFDMVFSAAEGLKAGKPSPGVPKFVPTGGVGTAPQHREMADLFIRLRKDAKKLRWTSEIDEELDRKKEEIDLCDTDAQLMEWATNEVFKPKEQTTLAQQDQLYPHLVAALMRNFRDKFHDPHLAFAIFDHAKNLSIYSYVFGCTAPAYNELIETRWFCFQDLRGILDALEEMKVNAVEADNRTRQMVETIRREAPTMRLLEEEDYFGKAQDRVVHILTQIEHLVRAPSANRRVARRRRPGKPWSEDWKDGVDEMSSETASGTGWSWDN